MKHIARLAAEWEGTNRAVAFILREATHRLEALPIETTPSMADGYDLIDIPTMLRDMMPKIDGPHLDDLREKARDKLGE